MWLQEAKWLSDVIYGMDPSEVFPMLDVGSASEEFRTVTQPWIDREIFAPARETGYPVVHTDLDDAPGVDLVGDLTDPAFLARLAAMEFRSVLCTNLLEHVTNRQEICALLEALVRPGGFILVTVPYRLNYHPFPIDPGYRPRPDEVAELFARSRVVRSAILDCGSDLRQFVRRPGYFAKRLARLCLPFYRPRRWLRLWHFRGWWFFSTFQETCVVLERLGEPAATRDAPPQRRTNRRREEPQCVSST